MVDYSSLAGLGKSGRSFVRNQRKIRQSVGEFEWTKANHHRIPVTKYDPALRDANGAYLADKWILFKQIGSAFGDVVLTEAEYLRVERAYINSAIAFLRESGFDSLTVEGIENPRRLRSNLARVQFSL